LDLAAPVNQNPHLALNLAADLRQRAAELRRHDAPGRQFADGQLLQAPQWVGAQTMGVSCQANGTVSTTDAAGCVPEGWQPAAGTSDVSRFTIIPGASPAG